MHVVSRCVDHEDRPWRRQSSQGHGERALGVESGGIQQKAVVPELRKSVGAGEIPTTLVLGDELSDGSSGMLWLKGKHFPRPLIENRLYWLR